MNVLFHRALLSGKVRIPESKSIAHRAYICNALAKVPGTIHCKAGSVDITTTVNCMKAITDTRINPSKPALLNCNESGSTLRFLLPVVCALGIPAVFTGSDYLAKRPISPLYEELLAHGMEISPAGSFPMTVSGKLVPGTFTLPGNISSQYISGLLFALPLLPSDSDIIITGVTESASYIGLTLSMLETFGIRIERTNTGYHIPGGQEYIAPKELTIEADWSSAAFFLAAGAIGTTSPGCLGLNPDSLQGDRKVLSALEAFGAQIRYSKSYGFRAIRGKMHGITLDVSDIPDLVPILAVVAAHSEGKTVFYNAGRLRLKESDRIAATEAMLSAFGVKTSSTEDTLEIIGGVSYSDEVDTLLVNSFNDHRIAMSCAIMASVCFFPVKLTQAEAVKKSYPTFYDHYMKLGGRIV